ncbi:hypothetical protein [Nonomuraea endophytica]|uniref:hypothetical protein n=1 Tax=Nonomuraea endophytica TaxID=714136 RepID=UPI0037CA92BE
MHRPLVIFGLAMAALSLVTGVALLIDDRTLDGMPLWAKPLKFAVSFTVYSFTWAWLLSLRKGKGRWGHRAGTILAVTATAEVAIIVVQASRVRHSHFNVATPLDFALWVGMGCTIAVLLLANIAAAVAVLLDRPADRPLAWAIGAGLIVSTIGLALGGLMIFPAEGQEGNLMGAHSVGLPDGGAGLPVLGWSTLAGDLRVPHFAGMHALQILPLLAPLTRKLHDTVRLRLIVIGGAGYTALLALLTWQALRGQPVVRPDALTLTVAAALAVAVVSAALASLRVPTLENSR